MKYAIFDMDGTLIDSMPLWEDVAGDYCEMRGLVPKEPLNKLFYNKILPEAAIYFKEEYHLEESVEKVLNDLASFAENAYRFKVPAKEGVAEALEYFQKQGIQMAIATANERQLAEAALKRLNLLPYFKYIATCSEVGYPKRENAAVFLKALDVLGGKNPQEAFVFEDAPHAIQTAKEAGFQIVGVYDEAYRHQWDKLENLSDHLFASAKEWQTLI